MAITILRFVMAIFTLSAIMSIVSAESFSEKTRNRGFNHQLFKQAAADSQKRQSPSNSTNSTTGFRFLTNKTQRKYDCDTQLPLPCELKRYSL